jgi:thiol:disulfide interchange protein
MNQATKPLLVIGLVLLGLASAILYSKLKEPTDLIPWRTDLTAGEAEAKTSGKKVMAYFTATWCGPCKQMKETTWSDAGVAERLKAYVPVKIDIDQHRDLARKFEVSGIPAFFVLTDSGEVLRQSGAYMEPGQFLEWLK